MNQQPARSTGTPAPFHSMDHLTFCGLLEKHAGAALRIFLPDGGRVPDHFHVTEVGLVRKDFIDCGGTRRSTAACTLQVWIADDTGHRLLAGKLAAILRLGFPLLGADALPVEIEYEDGLISQFPVAAIEETEGELRIFLTTKHTDCLAREKCGLPGEDPASGACRAGSGCC